MPHGGKMEKKKQNAPCFDWGASMGVTVVTCFIVTPDDHISIYVPHYSFIYHSCHYLNWKGETSWIHALKSESWPAIKINRFYCYFSDSWKINKHFNKRKIKLIPSILSSASDCNPPGSRKCWYRPDKRERGQSSPIGLDVIWQNSILVNKWWGQGTGTRSRGGTQINYLYLRNETTLILVSRSNRKQADLRCGN